MKHELLSPAGNMQALTQAVSNGADSVYIGFTKFSARANVKNFTNEEIVQALSLCHLYDVKLYVAMNTLVKDDEVSEFLGEVEYLYRIGVDAILMQDFGMICLCRLRYPNLEIHASTQVNVSSDLTASFLESIGVKRVVLSREISLKDEASMNSKIEKEVFIHGALCSSYSGCCSMSYDMAGKSANRGDCSSCCRLPYSLYKGDRLLVENKYLLSMKDINTSSRFNDLLNSNVSTFKIEGRAKSPEYVGFVTRFYRKLIDNSGIDYEYDDDIEKIKVLYNRGFTVGRLFDASDEDVINQDNPKHIGVEIGRVLEVDDTKIKIQLDKSLNQQDGVRFRESDLGMIANYIYDESGKLINSSSGICYLDNKIGLKTCDRVYKTLDYNLVQKLQRMPARKISVTFKVTARGGRPFEIEVSDSKHNLKITGPVVELAKSAPLTMQNIREHIEKLGDTPFVSNSTLVDMDVNIFVPVSVINDLRRTLMSNLMQLRMNERKDAPINNNISLDPIDKKSDPGITARCENRDQLEQLIKLKLNRIYVSNSKIMQEYGNTHHNIYYVPTRNSLHPDRELNSRNIVGELYDYTIHDFMGGDYFLNVFNVYTLYYLLYYGLDFVTLSCELTFDEQVNLVNNYIKIFNRIPPVEIVCYGYIENMVIKGNILNLDERNWNYKLKDSNDNYYKVYYDGVNTHVYSKNKVNYDKVKLDEIKKFVNIRYDFIDEDEKTIKNIIESF